MRRVRDGSSWFEACPSSGEGIAVLARLLTSSLPGLIGLLLACSSDDANDSDYFKLATCNATAAEANAQRLVLQGNARRACDAGEDCVLVAYALSCVSGCASYAAVARATEGMLASSVQHVDDTVCPEYFARGCEEFQSKACPPFGPMPVATCDDGVCMLHFPEP
jgi:hypothetical protein